MTPKHFYDAIRNNSKIKNNMYDVYHRILSRRLVELRELYKNEADFNKKQLYQLEAEEIKKVL